MSTQDGKGNEYPQSELPILYKATDVARSLGIAVKTVNKLVREGKLGCVQITAKERRFTADQVHAYIDTKSNIVVVDTPHVRQVSSRPKKGGDGKESGQEKAKDSWASLQEEMSQWM